MNSVRCGFVPVDILPPEEELKDRVVDARLQGLRQMKPSRVCLQRTARQGEYNRKHHQVGTLLPYTSLGL